jgi:hypothetical protein
MLVASPVKRAIDHHIGGPVTLLGRIHAVDLCSEILVMLIPASLDLFKLLPLPS